MRHVTPPQAVYLAGGSPAVPEVKEGFGRCFVCVGQVERGARVVEYFGSNYTDQNRARCPTAEYVCEACVHVQSWVNPPGRVTAEGKARGFNFRMVSHLFERGWEGVQAPEYANATKGEKPLIRSFLERDHGGMWFAAIADSGQKHVLPFVQWNPRGRSGVVLLDELVVKVPSTLDLVGEMTALLTAGATKEEIESGRYGQRAYALCCERVLSFERANASHRGGAWFTLALWLAQRDEEAVAARMAAEKEAKSVKRAAERKPKDTDRGRPARAKKGVPEDKRVQRPEALGPVAGPSQGGSENDGKPGGVGNQAPARPSDLRAGQLGIPGFG